MLQDAITCSLGLLGVSGLEPIGGTGRFELPDLDARHGGDPNWAPTLDILRAPPENGRRDYQWRREAPIRPVTFEPPVGIDDSVVQLHLSHRLVQRLLGRFTAQGFVYDDLSRACFAVADDRTTRVVLLGRLAVYGPQASRLHEELITITARWVPPGERREPLKPYGREGEETTLQLLQDNLGGEKQVEGSTLKALENAIARDVEELLGHLEPRGAAALADAQAKLVQRGVAEAEELTRILQDQRKRVVRELDRNQDGRQLEMDFGDDPDGRKQREADIRYWGEWLTNVDGDLQREPQRIRDFYTVKSHRLEPIGLVYLVPTRA